MRTLPKALLVGALAASATFAATSHAHVLTVALPDGSVARIHYVGDQAPRVVVAPTMPVAMIDPAPFALFDRIAADMNRQVTGMLRQAASLPATTPATDGKVDRAAFAGGHPGSYRYSYVSSTNGTATCSRSVQVTSCGQGQQPKIVSQSSGDCAAMNRPALTPTVQPAGRAAPQLTPASLNKTKAPTADRRSAI